MRIIAATLFALAAGTLLVGCAARTEEPPQSPGPAPDPQEGRPGEAIEVGGDVTLKSVALAGRVAWASLRGAGGAIGGLFRGGGGEAERTWDVHTRHTRDVARREAAHVRDAARGSEEAPPATKNTARLE